MIKKTKTYLKEVQEKYIENDLFRVILGLFISSVSFSTLLLLPEKLIEEISMTDMGVNIFFIIFTGMVITMSGLIPIVMGVIHKLLKTEGKKFIAGVIMMCMAFFIPPASIYGIIPILGTLITMSVLFG
ncbi:hypothetical protein RYB76_005213 [Klebsiella pneumoniae]|nr:hypothetical protein [Klebsiella pneumoniae]HAJ5157832.1 hypothetical protein [Escherichia coli]EKZ5352910.1 hypothetical protein [Klebsiella pneumoniae]EKZ6517952.1 hypothetical protein [Klebsiella pneumoniae]EKZ6523226.1 hypothetical protein [Klebsiella pneumoniae]